MFCVNNKRKQQLTSTANAKLFSSFLKILSFLDWFFELRKFD